MHTFKQTLMAKKGPVWLGNTHTHRHAAHTWGCMSYPTPRLHSRGSFTCCNRVYISLLQEMRAREAWMFTIKCHVLSSLFTCVRLQGTFDAQRDGMWRFCSHGCIICLSESRYERQRESVLYVTGTLADCFIYFTAYFLCVFVKFDMARAHAMKPSQSEVCPVPCKISLPSGGAKRDASTTTTTITLCPAFPFTFAFIFVKSQILTVLDVS